MNLTSDQISVILALSGLIIGTVGLVIGTLGFIQAKANSQSTHSVQLMPVDSAVDQFNEEYLKSIKDNDWASSPAELDKQNRLYSEQLEETMPEFSPTEEDREIVSF